MHGPSVRRKTAVAKANVRHSKTNLRHRREARVFGLGMARTTVAPPPHAGWKRILSVTRGHVLVHADSLLVPVFGDRGLILAPDAVMHAEGRADVRVLYVRDNDSRTCGPVYLTPLYHALVDRAVVQGYLDPRKPRDLRLLEVLYDECDALVPRDDIFTLPMPCDPRLIAASCSQRTLQRIARKELGIGLARWRRRYVLLTALTKIALGAPVTDCAYDSGYATASAFAHACRREFGETPLALARRLR